MRAKKIRRKCSVRGCKNIETYSIARSHEVGNSVIICKSCLEDALKEINNPTHVEDMRVAPYRVYAPAEKPATVAEPTEKTVAEPTAPIEPVEGQTQDAEVPPTDASEFVCPHCGQICKSESGLQAHIRMKHKDMA